METLNLTLYPTLEPRFQVTPTVKPNIVSQEPKNTSPLASLESALNSILPTQSEETNILKTRRILGETAETLSDEQMECIVAEFQFLANSWLDEFEREVFDGMTLKEVLHEG